MNFWQPGGARAFRTLSPWEPFLFKLHAPENYIAGGGFFIHSVLLPSRMAWDALGEKNAVGSYQEMWKRIAKHRRGALAPREDPTIDCILLGDPFFLDESAWIPAPTDFSPNIVQGKTYDLASTIGREIWQEVMLRRTAPCRSSKPRISAM